MWGHRFQRPLLQTVSARGDKSKLLRDFIVDALAPCQPRRRARISIGITAIIITPALFRCSMRLRGYEVMRFAWPDY